MDNEKATYITGLILLLDKEVDPDSVAKTRDELRGKFGIDVVALYGVNAVVPITGKQPPEREENQSERRG